MRFLQLIVLFTLSNLATANESFFDDTRTLTAEEEFKSDQYIHQGVADSEYQEMCNKEGKYSDICTNNDSAFSGGGEKTLEAMIPAVTKVYSMISMFGGSDFTSHKVDKDGNELYNKEGSDKAVTSTKEAPAVNENGDLNEGYSEDTESKKDYCGYMTIAVETVGAAYMSMQNNNTKKNYVATKPEARQAASFYALSDTHKNMGKASKTQGYMWGGITGCYGAMLATQNISGDWKIYAKLAGSVLITAFHLKKSSAHDKRAKMLKDMAKKLPQAGDCNPYTDTTCFCNEESSQRVDPANFKKFCIPKIIADRTTDPDAFICVDENRKADLSCKCAESNSCIDKVLKMGGLDFGLAPNIMKNPIKGFSPVSSGYIRGNLDSATKQNLALGKKALANFKPKNLPSLTVDQKKTAANFHKLGIPKAASVFLAKTKTSGGKLPASLATMSPTGSSKALTYSNYKKSTKGKLKRFTSGGGKSGNKSKRSNPFSKFKRKSGNKTTGIDIENFARKAQREAEIVQDHSKGIFDIISYRYKMSAWKKFPESLKSNESLDQEKK
jgi:hypothetical protein